jgi:hypothetical protein
LNKEKGRKRKSKSIQLQFSCVQDNKQTNKQN